MCVCKGKQRMGGLHIVKNEGLVTADWFSLERGFTGEG